MIRPTKEQKKAIEAGEGPLLIIAGAGTGKTFTITQRILYLLRVKNISVDELVALTFTEKAANEMSERVEAKLPLGFPEINISTFHAFCDGLLRDEAYRLGLSPDYNVMTKSQEIFFVRRNIYSFGLDKLLPAGNPSKFIYGIIDHVSSLLDEDISVEEYSKYVESVEGIDTDENEIMEELSQFHSRYEKLKKKHNVLSFGDLINNAVKLLRKNESVKRKWQEKLKYILVDEFQDTNYSQYELLKLLLPTKGKKNVMVVADDDQSIYKFRGAAVSNVMQFVKDFPDTKRVVLTENRRSVQEILDKSYKLIQNNNPERLEISEGIDKRLVEKGTELENLDTPFDFKAYKTATDEAEGIAYEIKDYIYETQKGEGQLSIDSLSQKNYHDIAVLVRSHSHSDEIVNALLRHGIPYQFSGSRKLFNTGEVKELINYLRVVADYTDNVAMNGLLDMDIWSLSDRDLVDLNILARKSSISIFEVLENSNERWQRLEKLVRLIKDAWNMTRDGKNIWAILHKFVMDSGLIESLTERSTNSSEEGQEVVRDIREEFENQAKLKNISRLFDYINDYEKQNRDSTVYEFMDYVELLLNSGDTPQLDDFEMEERNAVHIITAHSSKGLEFPFVIVPSLVRGRFPTRNKSKQFPIPEELLKEELPEKEQHIQEERRLMYVAITRAKERLLMTAAHLYASGKRKSKISPFVIETFNEDFIKSLWEDPIEFDASSRVNVGEKDSDHKIVVNDNKRKEKLNLSYTQISTYETCPRQYKYKYVLKVPTKSNPALSYGTTIHNTLFEFFNIKKLQDKYFDENKSELMNLIFDIYESKWVDKGYNSKRHEKIAFAKGKSTLRKFINEVYESTQTPVFLEKSFAVEIAGARVRGKIDRIDILGDEKEKSYEIIDYKTGDKKITKSVINRNEQLAIYSIAAEKVFNISPDKLTLLFVDQSEGISATSQKIEKMKEKVIKKIGEVVDGLGKGDFTATPGFSCRYCDFKNICKYSEV